MPVKIIFILALLAALITSWSLIDPRGCTIIFTPALIKAGVKTIVQPGGSIRDQEVINTANKAKIKMIFTGIRHFNH